MQREIRALCEKLRRQKLSDEGFEGFAVPPIKESISVLSLFDGISTALCALDNLRIHVKKYYSSEIDPDALRLQTHRYGDRVIKVGDVRSLTKEKLAALGDIDLLIGGEFSTAAVSFLTAVLERPTIICLFYFSFWAIYKAEVISVLQSKGDIIY